MCIMKVYGFSDGGAVCLLFLEVNFMACLLVPAAEAIVAAVGAKVLKTQEMMMKQRLIPLVWYVLVTLKWHMIETSIMPLITLKKS